MPCDRWIDRLTCRLRDSWPLQRSDARPSFRLLIEKPLLMISALYGGAVSLRAGLYQAGQLTVNRLSCPVVSVGNLTVGGTGKTPMTMYLADLFRQAGLRPAILSRGYKGASETVGGVVCDGKTILMPPEVAGDEPFLMAAKLKNVPVLVGKSRVDTGRLAIDRFHPDVIVLDDGFQHLKLKRDVNLVLLDSRSPVGSSHLLPVGDLREPISALHRADAFVFTRTGNQMKGDRTMDADRLVGRFPRRPVFRSQHVPYVYRLVRNSSADPGHLVLKHDPVADELPTSGRTLAFSGIARNEDFRNTAVSKGFRLAGFEAFADHHWYSQADMKRLLRRAREAGAAQLVTTEKDAVRMTEHISDFPIALYVIGVRISFGADTRAFSDFISGRLMHLDNR